MRKKLFLMLLMLGCFAVAGGCAKKQMMQEDETLAQKETVAVDTTATPEEVPVARDTVVTDQSVTGASAETVSPFDTLYFDFDSYVLRQDARDALDRNYQWLQKNVSAKVRLEGHCDERGSDEYNLALGEKRARAAHQYLSTLGVSPDRLGIISYGKENPADPGHNEDAWAKNRRVEFVIVK